MYPAGHYGVAMLFTSPVSLLLGRKSGTVVSAFVLLAALWPDLDKHLPYATHHGLTHTFLFAAASGIVVGLLAVGVHVAYVRLEDEPRYAKLPTMTVFAWAAVGMFLGTSAHVVADILVLLPGTQPVSPFWPVFERKLHVETLPLGAPARNLLLLVVGLVSQAFAFRYSSAG